MVVTACGSHIYLMKKTTMAAIDADTPMHTHKRFGHSLLAK
jgi:hypothetical protein